MTSSTQSSTAYPSSTLSYLSSAWSTVSTGVQHKEHDFQHFQASPAHGTQPPIVLAHSICLPRPPAHRTAQRTPPGAPAHSVRPLQPPTCRASRSASPLAPPV